MSDTLKSEEIINAQPNKWLILVAVAMFTFMATLDGSIINIAIPTISKSLGVPMNQSVWIISIYLVTICVFLLLFGKIGDMIGKVKVFKWGTILFVFGSFLCGIKINLAFLLFARVVQALGASMTMSNNFGIITEVFPVNQRGKALGTLGSFVSLGSIAGPGIGGIILANFDWSYIFWINIPFGLIAILFGARILPKDSYHRYEKMDIKGFIAFAASILILFLMIFTGQEIGFFNPIIAVLVILCLISFNIFKRIEKQVTNPLIDLNVFKNKLFTVGLLCAFLVFMGNFFFTVIMPFYLQGTLALSPSHAGMLLMVLSLVMMVATPVSGTLSDKLGRESLTFIGLVILSVSQIALVFLNEQTSVFIFISITVALGIGNALFQSPNNAIIMSSVPKNELGMAGGLNSLARNLGMVFGIAAATTILYTAMSIQAGFKVTNYLPEAPELFVSGMHVAFLVSFAIMLLATCLTGYRLFRKK